MNRSRHTALRRAQWLALLPLGSMAGFFFAFAIDVGPAMAQLDALLAEQGLERRQVRRIVATGYGRAALAFAGEAVTEITCHARGVRELTPEVGTVIDIGGQDSKAIWLDALAMDPVLSRTSRIVTFSDATKRLKAAASAPTTVPPTEATAPNAQSAQRSAR